MLRVSPQESGDVGGTGQQIEAALLDRLEMLQTNAQRHLDSLEGEATRFTLIAQQTADSTARRRLAFHRPPIDLIWHDCKLAPCRECFTRGPLTGQKRFDFWR